MVLSFTCDRFATWLLLQPMAIRHLNQESSPMVAANTRPKRTTFTKKVERWNANLVALTSLMVTLIGLLRQIARVVLIVVAVIAVFSPGLLPLVAAASALLLQIRRA
ncbi:hypothetical protein [Kribbella sp. NPDC004875]|uniref:hypothetical protein n=1 Tax=Kribbella sp. NPDC004875 TaxID=3364107 RepID=UPI0036C3AEE2